MWSEIEKLTSHNAQHNALYIVSFFDPRNRYVVGLVFQLYHLYATSDPNVAFVQHVWTGVVVLVLSMSVVFPRGEDQRGDYQR